jgi:hypothetical protein
MNFAMDLKADQIQTRYCYLSFRVGLKNLRYTTESQANHKYYEGRPTTTYWSWDFFVQLHDSTCGSNAYSYSSEAILNLKIDIAILDKCMDYLVRRFTK